MNSWKGAFDGFDCVSKHVPIDGPNHLDNDNDGKGKSTQPRICGHGTKKRPRKSLERTASLSKQASFSLYSPCLAATADLLLVSPLLLRIRLDAGHFGYVHSLATP